MSDTVALAKKTLDEVGKTTQMSPSTYDTAWLARLDNGTGSRALSWIRDHQHADGAWGAPSVSYNHDKVICTLAAMAALLNAGYSPKSPTIQRAARAFSKDVRGLETDHGATIGFELIVPTLLSEVEALGVPLETSALDDLMWPRSSKLSALPDRRIDRRHTPSFSAEAVGRDHLSLLDAENLQAANGSVAFSPSASAFFAYYVRPGDQAALAYLDDVIDADGAVPCISPIEVFDHGWALWNFSLDPSMARSLDLQAHVDFLTDAWVPGKGVASAIGLPLYDADDTAVVHSALYRLGTKLDLDAIRAYKGAYHFRCYALESDPSTSTNIHVLEMLRQVLQPRHEDVQLALSFLQRTRIAGAYWLDKWHASPYYPTCHAVIALAGVDDAMAQDAVEWILSTQRGDGAWGWYHYLPTAEETAYALQALATWKRRYPSSVPEDALTRGYQWLTENDQEPYPPLWIGKSLYTPKLPVKSGILSAKYLVEKIL